MSKEPDAVIAHPRTEEELRELKTFMEKRKIRFEITKSSPYDPEFVTKIQRSRKQVEEGKTQAISLDDIWRE